MIELFYTILELEEWNTGGTCDFCSSFENSENQSVCQLRTRSKVTEKLIANDCACQKCKEKFENDELSKCKRCKRLETKLSKDTICDCIRYNEEVEEKELPILPHEGRPYAFYERQINDLREKLTVSEETVEMEREVHEASLKRMDDWYTKYQNTDKADLLKRVVELEKEIQQLREQNKQLASEELAQKVEKYEKEITELKEQLEAKNQQAQIEIPSKDKGIKGFFKFGGKK